MLGVGLSLEVALGGLGSVFPTGPICHSQSSLSHCGMRVTDRQQHNVRKKINPLLGTSLWNLLPKFLEPALGNTWGSLELPSLQPPGDPGQGGTRPSSLFPIPARGEGRGGCFETTVSRLGE